MTIDLSEEEITALLNLVEREIARLDRYPAETSALYPLLLRMETAWRGLDMLAPIRDKLLNRQPRRGHHDQAPPHRP